MLTVADTNLVNKEIAFYKIPKILFMKLFQHDRRRKTLCKLLLGNLRKKSSAYFSLLGDATEFYQSFTGFARRIFC